jgi:hypothetical protein
MDLTDSEYEQTRGERERGLRELSGFLAAQAAFRQWQEAHPEQAEVVLRALTELKQLRERGDLAA